MVQPQRGHREPEPEIQVVPQLEHVLAELPFAVDAPFEQHPLVDAALPHA